ncbi:MAG: 4-amino-4-deoxy-L-arabinose-phosphoundecaprenol flippase subunit ArnF [Sodalis sp.]|uniref:hypothetical protein n=1 Tax=Sodalis sp. (in: enterobacteria) TaxID=1898979 RepID=UPI0038739937|nr:MAG: 4-amino-4-deoxy-L-arabinose-phosphoundecaprenol flippase subunit ArnF [Sodalis sp.]
MALRRLPLNKTYPLLSLSYAPVAAYALMIPEFHERLTLSRLVGVALICGGLLLICPPSRKKDAAPRLANFLMLPSAHGGIIGHFEPATQGMGLDDPHYDAHDARIPLHCSIRDRSYDNFHASFGTA